MVQCRGAPLQLVQVVLGRQDLLVPAVGTRMGGDHQTPQHHVDAVDVGLDRHLLEGRRAGHAVAVGIEAHHLVLVDLRRLEQARIESRARP